MQNVVAYLWSSARETGGSTDSIQAQAKLVEEYAEKYNLTVVEIFTDVDPPRGPKNAFHNRKKLTDCLTFAAKRKCPIIISSISRLTRNAEAFERFISTISIDLIIIGAIVSRNALLVRSLERDKLPDLRTRTGRLSAREQMNSLNDRSNWQLKGRTVVVNKARARLELFAIKYAACIKAKLLKPREIALAMNQNGFRTPQGRLWTANNVYRTYRAWTKLGVKKVPSPDALDRHKKFGAVYQNCLRDGHTSAKEIAAQLNVLGYKNSIGKRWTDRNVYYAVRKWRRIDIAERLAHSEFTVRVIT